MFVWLVVIFLFSFGFFWLVGWLGFATVFPKFQIPAMKRKLLKLKLP